MITKKELIVRICELESRLDILTGTCKRVQSRLTKLEKATEKKVIKKVK